MTSTRAASALAISCAMVPALIDSLGNHVLPGQQYRQVFVPARREDRDGWECAVGGVRQPHAYRPPRWKSSRHGLKRKARNSRAARLGSADPSTDGTSTTPQPRHASGVGKRTARPRNPIDATRCARRGISRFRSISSPPHRPFPPSTRRQRAPKQSATKSPALCPPLHPDTDRMTPPERQEKREGGPNWWEATEEGRDRVIKRRKLSKLELHVACARRPPPSTQVNCVLGRKRPLLGTDPLDGLGDVPFGILRKLRGRGQAGLRDGQDEEEDPSRMRERPAWSAAVLMKGGRPTDASDSDVSKHLGNDAQVGFEDKGKQTIEEAGAAWNSLHAAEVFKVNTEGMRRCSDGYRNEHGRMPSFSLLGDVVDDVFGALAAPTSVPVPKVPIVRLPRHEVEHAQIHTSTACKAPVWKSQTAIRQLRKPELAHVVEHSYTHGRVLAQPPNMPTSSKSARGLQGLSGRVRPNNRAEDFKPQLLPCRAGSKQFHSFVQSPIEMQTRQKPSESHTCRAGGGFSSDRRVRGVNSQASLAHKVDSGGIKLLVQGDPSHAGNHRTWTPTNKVQLQHLPVDFVDMLRRHGLTIPAGDPNSVVFGRRAHPACHANRLVCPQASTGHRQFKGNVVVYNKDKVHMQHPLPVYHAGQPMGRPKKGSIAEKNYRLNQQPVLMKLSSRWNAGAQFDVEGEPFMLPVMMLQSDKNGQD